MECFLLLFISHTFSSLSPLFIIFVEFFSVYPAKILYANLNRFIYLLNGASDFSTFRVSYSSQCCNLNDMLQSVRGSNSFDRFQLFIGVNEKNPLSINTMHFFFHSNDKDNIQHETKVKVTFESKNIRITQTKMAFLLNFAIYSNWPANGLKSKKTHNGRQYSCKTTYIQSLDVNGTC